MRCCFALTVITPQQQRKQSTGPGRRNDIRCRAEVMSLRPAPPSCDRRSCTDRRGQQHRDADAGPCPRDTLLTRADLPRVAPRPPRRDARQTPQRPVPSCSSIRDSNGGQHDFLEWCAPLFSGIRRGPAFRLKVPANREVCDRCRWAPIPVDTRGSSWVKDVAGPRRPFRTPDAAPPAQAAQTTRAREVRARGRGPAFADPPGSAAEGSVGAGHRRYACGFMSTATI